MAIDTATKRFSMMNFWDGSVAPPRADGSFDAGDRATLLDLYSGVTLNNPTPGGGGATSSIARYASTISSRQ